MYNMSHELILVPKLRYEELIKQEVNKENEKKLQRLRKMISYPLQTLTKTMNLLKILMEGGGRSYISLSPAEFSEIKSNKEKVLKHETKTNTRKILKHKKKSSVKLKWLSFII